MRVSQRLDYALRALVLLAEQPPGSWVVAGDLAERLGLPKRFVEQQVTALARIGVVTCRRGATGGCTLARPAGDVTVAEIVRGLQGEVLDTPHQLGSASAEMWQQAAASLEDFLGAITLADLATRQRELDRQSTPMYYI